MEVILRSDVEKLGLKGDVVDVKRGYARNYLLPRRLAEVATPGRVAEMRRIEADRARHEARSAEHAAEIAETLTKTVLRFEVKAGPTGALFGSVTPTDVAEELWRTRKIRVDRRKIDIDVIKRIGRYSIPVHVFEGVTAEVKTLVVPEGGELPPEEELAALEAAERAEAEAAEAAHAEAVEATEAALAEDEVITEPEPAAEADVESEPLGPPVFPQRRPHSPQPRHEVCGRTHGISAGCGCRVTNNLRRAVDNRVRHWGYDGNVRSLFPAGAAPPTTSTARLDASPADGFDLAL
jgi:large subunit ribosomal protein L9